MILATKSLILFSSFAYLASQPARVRIASSSPFVEFYESHTHTHTVDMFIRASEQQHQAYGYTAESECVTITANVRILQQPRQIAKQIIDKIQLGISIAITHFFFGKDECCLVAMIK